MWITFLLTAGAGAAVPPPDHGYRPAFHHDACARYLLRRERDVRDVILEDVAPRFVATVGRAPVESANAELDLDHVPDFLWFTSDPLAPEAENAARVAAAAENGANAVHFRRGKKRLARFVPERALSSLEKSALGLQFNGVVRTHDVRGVLTTSPAGLRLDWSVRGGPAGGFVLSADDVRVGYTNIVYEWQYLALGEHVRANRPRERFRPRVADFFDQEVHAMFTREATSGRRFGYFLTSTQLEVVGLDPSRRLAAGVDDIVFPTTGDAHAGQMNLRLTNLGLAVLLIASPARE